MRLYSALGLILFVLGIMPARAQDIELFDQLNGPYDYLAFGNTLNPAENGDGNCSILTESSADFQLQPGQTLVKAYLYWAGSGEGDFEVTLNDEPIQAERTFAYTLNTGNGVFPFFGAMSDVTELLANSGSRSFLLSDLDLTGIIAGYCSNATNFGGWAITVVFEDPTLPLNQVNIFDGFEAVGGGNTTLSIELENLEVLDNVGAKIGFLAWEGDSGLAVNETLRLNGSILSNPPLNPANNAFNGTNSFTNSSDLYNMDLDVYDIQDNIDPGDTGASIQLTSGQDLVVIHNIITVLNTELPDASIDIELDGSIACGDTSFDISYTVSNLNSTGELKAGTPIAFYANGQLIGQTTTQTEIPINGSENGTINLPIPPGLVGPFLFTAVVDDDGTGNGTVSELNEDNNTAELELVAAVNPVLPDLPDLETCDLILTETFDLTEATTEVTEGNVVTFHLSLEDAQQGDNPIDNPEAYENTSSLQTIWVRIANEYCFVVDSFTIEVVFCPYPDAQITLDNAVNACRDRDSRVEYTVLNVLGRGPLPAGTPIVLFAQGELLAAGQTRQLIPIGGRERGVLEVEFPDDIADEFVLTAKVDDDGEGNSMVLELDEENNETTQLIEFVSIPELGALPDLELCDAGFERAEFDLTQQDPLVRTGPLDEITYYIDEISAIAGENAITDPVAFENTSNPQLIYVRLENDICFTTGLFEIKTERCPPVIPQGLSPNGDGMNDEFRIEGLLDIFTDFELQIYSRYGNLIYEGGNEDGFWDGRPNRGVFGNQGQLVPTGTYYYVLNLNDPLYREAKVGYIYVNY
jgi:gliding motility-associated-like protein